MVFGEVAQRYADRGLSVFPVRGKHVLPKGSTGAKGMITPFQVDDWASDPEWAGGNIALRHDTDTIAIDVDHYGDKRGADQLAALEKELGPLPVTVSCTARGEDSPSRQYFFQVPDGLHFVGKVAEDIEVIQHGHRYSIIAPSWHPHLGTQYIAYDAEGNELEEFPGKDEFERLPDAWVEYLKRDKPEEHAGFNGTITDWLDSLSDGGPSHRVIAAIQDFPRENFNHTDVVSTTWRLVRLGAEGEPGVRHAFEELYKSWVKPPYDKPNYVRELDLAVLGAIRKAGRIATTPKSLPDYFAALELLPSDFDSNLLTNAKDLDDLAKQLFAVIESERDVAALVWKRAKALGASEEDFSDFYERLLTMQEVHKEELVSQDISSYGLITEAEREKVSTMETFVEKYLNYSRMMVPDGYLNEPYHRAAAWTAASMIYGEHAYYVTGGNLGFNLWWGVLGESSTGKNESMNPLIRLLDAYFGKEADYKIGADASSVGMHRKLLAREDKSSIMVDDEISGPMRKWLQAGDGAFTDMPDRLTSFYEGWAPPLDRAASSKEEKMGAHIHLCAYWLTTPSRFFNVVSSGDWASGFLARVTWAVGNGRAANEKIQYRSPFIDISVDEEGESEFISEWAEQLKSEVYNLAGGVGKRFRIQVNRAARHRMESAGSQVLNMFNGHKLATMLEPSVKRMMNVAWKCAGLIAAGNGRAMVIEDDVLYVLREMETWLKDLVYVASNAASSPFSAKLAKVLDSMKEYGATQVPTTEVFKWMDEPYNKVQEAIRTLVAQGKIKEVENAQYLELVKKGKQ